MEIKAVILDLGKTLVNDPVPLTSMGQIFERYGEEVGLPSEAAEDWFRIYANAREEGLKTLKEATFLDALKKVSRKHEELRLAKWEIMNILKFMYDKSHADAYSLLPGAKELLAYIKGRGLSLGLVSNTAWPGRFHEDDMKRLGIFESFNSLIWSSEEEIRKPHCELFLKSLRELRISEKEAVFGGDTFDRDVAGANSVGIPAIWISDKTPPQLFNGCQIKDLFEMINLLDEIL